MTRFIRVGILLVMSSALGPVGTETAIAKPGYCREAFAKCVVECGDSIFLKYGCEVGCGIAYLAC